MAKQYQPEPAAHIEGQSERPPRAALGEQLMSHHPSPPFILKGHPMRWGIYEGEYLPRLSTIKVDPGVGGVDKNHNTAIAEKESRRRGYIVIDDDVVEGGYLRRTRVKKGWMHHTRWVTPTQVGNMTSLKRDPRGYKQFLQFLVAEGVVPVPPVHILEGLADIVRTRLDNLTQAGKHEGRTARAAEAELKSIQVLITKQAAAEAAGTPSKPKGKTFTAKGKGKKSNG